MISSFIVVIQYTQDIQQGGFPRSGSPHNRHKLPLPDFQIHPFQHMERLAVVVGFMDVL